jgi:hypothetical protein
MRSPVWVGLACALVLGACAAPASHLAPPSHHALAAPVDPREQMIEERKDDLLKRLAICESGDWGPAEKPIYGGRGIFHGRFQFMIRTVQGFVLQIDGRALTIREATNLAHDWDQSLALAKYIIFELDGISHWPLCNRKHGLAAEVRAIKAL